MPVILFVEVVMSTKINEDVVKQIALRCTRSCVLWMFGFAEIKGETIENDRTFSITDIDVPCHL
jgi:hypothetical protein